MQNIINYKPANFSTYISIVLFIRSRPFLRQSTLSTQTIKYFRHRYSFSGAKGGSRTRTKSLSAVFKTAASAVPPLWFGGPSRGRTYNRLVMSEVL